MAKLVTLLFTESRAQPTHATGVPEREPAAEPAFPAVEVPVYEGEAALNAAEAARVRELGRAFARIAFACAEHEPGTRPTAIEVLTRARALEHAPHNLNGAPMEEDELPVIDEGAGNERQGAALLIGLADPPEPATADATEGTHPHPPAAARAPETSGAEPTNRHRSRSHSDASLHEAAAAVHAHPDL